MWSNLYGSAEHLELIELVLGWDTTLQQPRYFEMLNTATLTLGRYSIRTEERFGRGIFGHYSHPSKIYWLTRTGRKWR